MRGPLRFKDRLLSEKLKRLTWLVGAVAGLVGCFAFILYDLSIARHQIAEQDVAYLVERDAGVVVLVLLTSMLLSMLASRRLAAVISQPLTSLAETARRVRTEQSYHLRFPYEATDEVGELADSFNEMLTAIEAREQQLRSAYELFDRFMNHSPAVAFIKDEELRYVFVNDACVSLMGRPRGEIVGKQDGDLWPPAVADQLAKLDGEGLSAETGLVGVKSIELPLPHGLGVMHLSMVRFTIRDSAGYRYLGCTGLDETARVKAQLALAASDERYALAVRGASDGMWDWDLDNATYYYSPRCLEMLGATAVGNTLDTLLRLIHSEDRVGLNRGIQRLVEGEDEQLNAEFRLARESEPPGWLLMRATALRGDDGRAHRIAGFLTDISERKARESQLRHDAFHDSLTGLPNRSLFLDRLSRAVERARRHPDTLFAVMFLDLDGFKSINDTLGHGVGDQLLCAISAKLLTLVRAEDTVARLGGDEFTVLLEEISHISDASRVAERLNRALLEPIEAGGHPLRTGTSIGIALSSTGYARAEDMLADADSAMYLAKRSGKSTYRIFDEEMHLAAESRLQLEARFRRSYESGELQLYYQPIYQLGDETLLGAEALLRWNDPDKGMLMPGKFLAAAEDTGQLLQLSKPLWQRSLEDWKAWRACRPGLGLTVNLSVRQFQHPGLVEIWSNLLRQNGLTAEGITLDVTERALARDSQGGQATLGKLRKLGFSLALDDYGCGQSSLECLRTGVFDTVKLDRGLLKDSPAQVVQGLVQVVNGLGLRSFAEGVEAAGQLKILRDAACWGGQGHLWSPALAPSDFLELVRKPA